MNLQRFVPDFIKRLDHYLLTHYPIIWQSRIHNVFYAVAITNLLFGLLAVVMPLGLADRHEIWTWVWTFFVASVTYLAIWMVHVGRFNLFKQYGKRPVGDEYLNFGLHFLCVALITSTMFAFPYFYGQKVKNLLSDTEMAQDINTLNLGAGFFPRTEYNYSKSDENNSTVTNTLINLYDFDNFSGFHYQRYKDYFENVRSDNDWGNQREQAYQPNTLIDPCPWEISPMGLYCYTYTKKLFNKKRTRPEQIKLINDFIQTASKYGISVPHGAEYYLDKFDAKNNYTYDMKFINYQDYIFFSELERKLGDVMEYKTGKTMFEDKDFWHFMWYAVFYTTLFFIIYRNVRRRDYILSVVSGIVILVVTGIYFGVSGNNNEKEVFNVYFIIYLGAVIGSVAIFFGKAHSWFNAACLNLVLIVTPFMPVYYYQVHRTGFSNDMHSNWEIAGFVLFFFLLQLLFKKLYATLWALPEK